MTKRVDIERALLAAGFVWVSRSGRGAHEKFRRGVVMVAVPRHREIAEGTARAIMRSAGLE